MSICSTLHFMIIVHEVIWKYSFGPRGWMMWLKLEQQIIAYEKKQEKERRKRNQIPKGECLYFDEAYERGMRLWSWIYQNLM